jgi:hypothetical protein
MLYREIIAVCSEIHTKHINTLCGQNVEFLGAFAKLRKATISFVISVRPSVRMERLGSPWTDFREVWYLRIFRKSAEQIQVSLISDKNNGYFTLISDKNNGYFTLRPVYIYDNTSLNCSQNENCFRQKLERKSKHTSCSIIFFSKSRPVYEIIRKIW